MNIGGMRLWPNMHSPGRTAVCAIVRNEQNDISEWIAYHLVLKFDTILVFDNMSNDDTPRILDAYARKYDVRRVPWTDTSRLFQVRAYDAALKMLRRDCDWLCFI